MWARRHVSAALGVATLFNALAVPGALAEGEMEATGASEREPFEVCEPAAIPFDPDTIQLTGLWSADDGSIYYVRQVGDKVWFSAMSDYQQVRGEIGRELSSVGYGTIAGTTLTVEVADVPRGNVYNSGNASVMLDADADGNLFAHSEAPDGTRTEFTPCQPLAIQAGEFAQPFRYTVPFGLASWNEVGTSDLGVMYAPDPPQSGVSFWVVGPGWEASCSAPDLAVPADHGAASLEAYLRAVPELVVGDASAAIVDGRPATVLDVTTAPDPTGCDGDEYVRMFRVSGNESGLDPGRAARLVLLEIDGSTFVIELWGPDPEAWWPIAQGIVDSVSFEGVAGSEETAEPALPSAPPRPEGWPTVTSGRGDLRLSLPPGFGVGDASGAIFANRIPGDDGRWVQLMAEGPRAKDFPPPGPDEPLDEWVERRWLGSEEPLEPPTTRTLLLPAGEALEWRGTIRADPVRTLLLYAIRTSAGVAFVSIDGPPEEMELLAADIDLILHLLEVE